MVRAVGVHIMLSSQPLTSHIVLLFLGTLFASYGTDTLSPYSEDAMDEGEARGQAPITKIHRNRFHVLPFFYIPERGPAEPRV
ncbi:hypothetical protein K0M31_019493 [Melipona bicolor]|uniref:Uncharacterized protein n=1 Tax=Melipona bicolor TaxID=60889 RepID=A0AA40G2H2_9HYME|nr:hypothetical protein K0M31_019493 [Melipona bicolor]